MRLVRCWALTSLSLALALSFGLPAAAGPVRIALLTEATQTSGPGGLLPTPLSVRVERATGEPIPGVQLSFSVDLVMCWSPPLPGFVCPTDDWYGGFETGEVPMPIGVYVTTGADGVATVPPFRLGTPPAEEIPFAFSILPYASTQTTPGGFTITLFDAVHPIGGRHAAATTVWVEGTGATAIPVLDSAGFVALGLLLAAASLWRMRRLRSA